MNISNLQLNEATGKYIIASELSSDEIIQAAKKILNSLLLLPFLLAKLN